MTTQEINTHTSCYWDQCTIRLIDDEELCTIISKIPSKSFFGQPYNKLVIQFTGNKSHITTCICDNHIK